MTVIESISEGLSGLNLPDESKLVPVRGMFVGSTATPSMTYRGLSDGAHAGPSQTIEAVACACLGAGCSAAGGAGVGAGAG